MIRWIVVIFFATTNLQVFPQEKAGYFANKNHWKQVKKQIPQYNQVFKNSDKYRFEVIYGQVNTDKTGSKKVRYYQTGSPDIYYYPASLVKFPMAVKLLEWLSHESVVDLSDLILRTVEKSACGFPISDTARHYYVKTKQTMHPTDLSILLYSYFIKDAVYDSLYHLPDSIPEGTVFRLTSKPVAVHMSDVLKEMLVQSDNANYNQVFEAIAPRNSNLDKLFYIPRPFIPCKDEYVSAGADFYLFDEKWKSLPGGNVQKKYDANMKNETVGIAQISGENDTIKTGRDFSQHNHVSLFNITRLMQEVIYSGSTNISVSLSEGNRRQLLLMLAANPTNGWLFTKREYTEAAFNKTNFLFPDKNSDSYTNKAKFYNIIGQAYGFTSDVLYYCDPFDTTEFFLSVRIYTNEDEVLNDDRYEYETIALPFMRDLFNVILEKERKRKVTSNRSLSFPEQR